MLKVAAFPKQGHLSYRGGVQMENCVQNILKRAVGKAQSFVKANPVREAESVSGMNF